MYNGARRHNKTKIPGCIFPSPPLPSPVPAPRRGGEGAGIIVERYESSADEFLHPRDRDLLRKQQQRGQENVNRGKRGYLWSGGLHISRRVTPVGLSARRLTENNCISVTEKYRRPVGESAR